MRVPFPGISWAWLTAGLFALLFASTFLARPIQDPDFFWHIKTGQWIWQNKALPDSDPFAFAPFNSLEARQSFLLTSYWLSQVFYYGIYSLGGWWGFFVLRGLLCAALAALLLLRGDRDSRAYPLLVAAVMLALLRDFPVERPQFFSFVLFALLLVAFRKLDEVVSPHDLVKNLLLVSGVMLLWGNLHGGFLLGQILCVYYVVTICYVKIFMDKGLLYFREKTFFLAVAIGLSFANPNAFNMYAAYKLLVSGAADYTKLFISEYKSVFELLKTGRYLYGIFPLLGVFSIAGLIVGGFRKNLPTIFLVGCFSFFAMKQMRYLPFFVILTLPSAFEFLANFGKKVATAGAVAMLGFVLLFSDIRHELANYAHLRHYGPIDRSYPAAAVDFIVQNHLTGKVLNHYGWGGYLHWSLPGDRKIFVDGRTLDLAICKDWIFLSSGMGVERLLDKYRFDMVLLPRLVDGQSVPLTELLLRNNNWMLVFNQDNTVVLLRRRDATES